MVAKIGRMCYFSGAMTELICPGFVEKPLEKTMTSFKRKGVQPGRPGAFPIGKAHRSARLAAQARKDEEERRQRTEARLQVQTYPNPGD